MSNRLRFRGRSGGRTAGDADVNAYIARAALTDPTIKIAAGALIAGLKESLLWPAYDVLILHASQDAAAGCVNVVRDEHHATIINGCSFTAYEGFTGNGSTMGLDVDFNFTTDGVAAQADNFGLSSYVRNDRTGDLDAVYTAVGCLGADPNYSAIALSPWGNRLVLGATRNIGSANSSQQLITATPATSRGLHQISRTGASATEYHINGVSKGTTTAASDALPNSTVGVLHMKIFNGSRERFSADQVSISAIRRGFSTAEAVTEVALFKAYMAALGRDTLP